MNPALMTAVLVTVLLAASGLAQTPQPITVGETFVIPSRSCAKTVAS